MQLCAALPCPWLRLAGKGVDSAVRTLRLPLGLGLGSAHVQEDSKLAPHLPVLLPPCGPKAGMGVWQGRVDSTWESRSAPWVKQPLGRDVIDVGQKHWVGFPGQGGCMQSVLLPASSRDLVCDLMQGQPLSGLHCLWVGWRRIFMPQRSGETRDTNVPHVLCQRRHRSHLEGVSYPQTCKGLAAPSSVPWGEGAQQVREAPSELPFYHF